MPGLEGCVDLDLEWSPSTNMLPNRRLSLSAGNDSAVSAAWVHRYRYRSGDFLADLEVDADGLVTSYDVNWRAIATGGWS